MPSPIAHISAGYAIYLAARRIPAFARAVRFSDWLLAIVAIFCCMLPDADAGLGFLAGDLGQYHNNMSHSLLTGVAAALLAAAAARIGRLGSPWRWALFALACCEVHVLMDFLCHGRGVMALWPLTAERFRAPVVLFYGLHWSQGFISAQHIWTILTETAFGVSLIWLVHRIRQTRHAVLPSARSRSVDGGAAVPPDGKTAE